MQRVVAASMLAQGTSTIYNPGVSNDCRAALNMATKTGAQIKQANGIISISSKGLKGNFSSVSCGESGLGLRMFTPILSTLEQEIIIDGEGSLTDRPVRFFETILPQLGVQCKSNEGKVPIRIKGPLKGGNIQLDGSLTSQFLTGLLMALPVVAEHSVIQVDHLKSIGYIDLTLNVLNRFGILVHHTNYQRFDIPGNQRYQPTSYTINGDWSGAAFHLVGAAISGATTFDLLHRESVQPDKKILDVLIQVGAQCNWKGERLIVSEGTLNPFSFDATNCPDLFPPLAALAANCNGISEIKGIERLAHKESHRAKTIQQELKQVGIACSLHPEKNVMRIEGGTIQGGTIDSHNDHRIAMMGAILALNAQDPIKILNPEAVCKSYPHFFSDLSTLGVKTDG